MSEEKGFDVDLKVSTSDENPALRAKKEIFDWLQIFASVIVVVVLLFTLVFKIASIEGSSMEDTLFENQKVIISKIFYTPKQGDIVVISRNKTNSNSENTGTDALPIIKRVIATEGQTVDIDFEKGIVYVDGKELAEPYIKTPTNTQYEIKFPVTVKKGCVFVMGDNRNRSLDSRSSQIGDNGMIDTRYIMGKVLLRVFPFNEFGGVE